MDGHWEWSDSGDEPDTGDTADLGGDPGFGQGFEQGHTFGGDAGYGQGFDGHDDFGHDTLGGDAHGGDDLEEPLGTEHAAEAYDQSVDESAHDSTDGSDGADGHDTHDGDGFEAADGDPAQHAEFEPVTDHHTGDNGDAGDTGDTGDTGDGHDTDVEAVQHADTFGSDPDLHPGDDGWPEQVFPEQLHLDSPPEPVDGFPWSDADVLGGPDHSLSAAYDPAADTGPADPADLAGYDGGVDLPAGTDPWSLLLSSEDPATSSLAGFWAPHT